MPLAEIVGAWMIAHSPMSGVVVAALVWGLVGLVGGYLRQGRSRAPRATARRRARAVVRAHYAHQARVAARERRIADATADAERARQR